MDPKRCNVTTGSECVSVWVCQWTKQSLLRFGAMKRLHMFQHWSNEQTKCGRQQKDSYILSASRRLKTPNIMFRSNWMNIFLPSDGVTFLFYYLSTNISKLAHQVTFSIRRETFITHLFLFKPLSWQWIKIVKTSPGTAVRPFLLICFPAQRSSYSQIQFVQIFAGFMSFCQRIPGHQLKIHLINC